MTTPAQSVTIGPARLSFPNLFEKAAFGKSAKQSVNDPTAKYGCSLLLPPDYIVTGPTAKAEAKRLAEMFKAVALEAFGANPKLTPGKSALFRKCLEEYEGYEKGWSYLRCVSWSQPQCVDQQVQPVLDSKMFYAGCWVMASLRPFAWNNEFGRGVSVGLNAVQFVKDGQRLDGRVRADTQFQAIDALDEGEPAGEPATAAKGKSRRAAPVEDDGESIDDLFG